MNMDSLTGVKRNSFSNKDQWSLLAGIHIMKLNKFARNVATVRPA